MAVPMLLCDKCRKPCRIVTDQWPELSGRYDKAGYVGRRRQPHHPSHTHTFALCLPCGRWRLLPETA